MIRAILRYSVVTLGYCFWHFIRYPFSRSSRYKMSAAFLSLKYPFYGNRHLELCDLLKNEELEVSIAPVKANRHNVSEFELLAICAVIKDYQLKKIFEIGTFDGRTTRAMALNSGNDGFVYTLNLPPETSGSALNTGEIDIQLASKVVSGERFINSDESKKILQLWGDSANFDLSPYFGKMDLVFIDGAHSETYAACDTENALQLIKYQGGWIIWHDAPYFGVVKFLKNWVPLQKGPVYFIKGTSLALAYVEQGRVAKSFIK